MKYSGYLDYVTLQKWGIRYDKAGPMLLFDWLYTVPSWAESVTTNTGEVFYFANRTRAIEELPFLPEKIDTIYRWYKDLEDMGLIVLKKIESKDYIMLTEKSKEWGRKVTKNGVESTRMEIRKPDGNPSKLGSPSEKGGSTPYRGKVSKREGAALPSSEFQGGVAGSFREELWVWSEAIGIHLPKGDNSFKAAIFAFLNRQDDEGHLKGRDRKDLTKHFFAWSRTQKAFITDPKWVEENLLEFKQTVNWYKKENHTPKLNLKQH